jgi:DHA3 family tetracycline resistance protein-like MFS transporter
MSGRKDFSPVAVYYALRGTFTFFFIMATSVNLVFQTSEAGLNPFQLVIVGAVLEATIFVMEIPTGVMADLYSRKLSVVLGLVLLGVGLIVNAAWTNFETILLGQLIWGCGYTFMSGAYQAWIADEIGIEAVGKVYLRAAQIEQIGRLVATPVAFGIATYQLNLPILLAGGAYIVMAPILALAMPERGFKRTASGQSWRENVASMTSTFSEGRRVVRGSPLLMTMLAIAAFYGMASAGFERLWVAHFYRDLGFPGLFNLTPIVWFGVLRTGSGILSVLAVGVLIKRMDVRSNSRLSRLLLAVNAVQAIGLFLFAGANGFVFGMVAMWSAVGASALYQPLFLSWLNQNVDSLVRATVISMRSQTDALGQIVGGPVLGLVGQLASLRLSIMGAGLALVPALALYARARRISETPPADAELTP